MISLLVNLVLLPFKLIGLAIDTLGPFFTILAGLGLYVFWRNSI